MAVNLLGFLACSFLLIYEHLAQSAKKSPAARKKPQMTCNTRLLNALRLTGHEEGEVPKNNTICGLSARENCCSQVDEIKILRSWNSFTKPKIVKFTEDMQQIFTDFQTVEPYLARLNTSQIEYHFDNVSWRRTNESQCFSGKFFLEQSNYDLLKARGNLTIQMVEAVAKRVAENFTQSTARGLFWPTRPKSTSGVCSSTTASSRRTSPTPWSRWP